MRRSMAWSMMLVIAGAGLVASGGAGIAPAEAQPALTGIDSIHEKRREGGKVCFVDHEHYGEGNLPSRRGAEAAAIRAWAAFVAEEYGTAWGHYRLAASKKMACKESGGRWACSVTARPCRSVR